MNPKKIEKSDGCHREHAQFVRTVLGTLQQAEMERPFPEGKTVPKRFETRHAEMAARLAPGKAARAAQPATDGAGARNNRDLFFKTL